MFMDPAVVSRTKISDAKIPLLHTEYEVMAIEYNSLVE